MKGKMLNLCLILTSLLGYLEWGTDNSAFLGQTELEIIAKLFTDTSSVIHPFILLPLAGQLMLFITLFQKQPSKILTYIALAGIGLLLAFIFLIGLMSMNFKVALSAVPFLATGVYAIFYYKKRRR